MINNGYLIVGIAYLIAAVLYFISISISGVISMTNYFSSDTNDKKNYINDPNSLEYKIYWCFNNFRYTCFVLLYIIIGVVYLLSQYHENK